MLSPSPPSPYQHKYLELPSPRTPAWHLHDFPSRTVPNMRISECIYIISQSSDCYAERKPNQGMRIKWLLATMTHPSASFLKFWQPNSIIPELSLSTPPDQPSNLFRVGGLTFWSISIIGKWRSGSRGLRGGSSFSLLGGLLSPQIPLVQLLATLSTGVVRLVPGIMGSLKLHFQKKWEVQKIWSRLYKSSFFLPY